MNLYNLFRPRYSEQECEFLGMNFISPVGTYVYEMETGISYAKLLLENAYSFVIVNCKDLSKTVSVLKKLPREYNIIAHLDVRQTYNYNGSEKTMEAAFGILYDFVDAFLISSIDSLSDDVDSLLSLRMYNDEYRPIILDVPSDILYADLDEILKYSVMSNVDGCLISNPRLLKYANEKYPGYLCLIAGNVRSEEIMLQTQKDGASLFCTNSARMTAIGLIRLGRQLLRKLHKDSSL